MVNPKTGASAAARTPATAEVNLTENAAIYPLLLLRVSRGPGQIISLVVDYGPEKKPLFYLVAGSNVTRFIPGYRFRPDSSTGMKATILSSPDLFQLSVADTTVTIEGLGFRRGDKLAISVFQEIPHSTQNPTLHERVVSTFSVTDLPTEWMSYTEIFLLIMLVIADILFFVIVHLRNKHLQKKSKQGKAASILIRNENISDTTLKKVSAVHLFGGFRIWDKSGEEITSGFSPMLKELFLILICKQPDEGITSAVLKDILWYDKNEESARNNRSVYFVKLRQLLDTLGEYSLSNRSGKWIINFHDIHVDFLEFSKIIRQETINENDVTKLVSIIRKGAILPECTYSWLDDIKAKVADYTITILSDYSDQLDKKMHHELLNSIADALFTVDLLNDKALTFKCRYYNWIGKTFLSKQLYANYLKEYRNQYGEEFTRSYTDVISEDN